METILKLLTLKNDFAIICGYHMSFIELIGLISGFASVVFASRLNPLTWSLGVINELAFLILFYQVQLYGAMLLQVFLMIVTVYGWIIWRQGNRIEKLPRLISNIERFSVTLSILVSTLLIALLSSHIDVILPSLFPEPAAFPLVDAFTAAASVFATILLAHKVIESWLLWITIDAVSISLYFCRGVPFLALLYGVFFLLAIRGLREWQRHMIGVQHI